MKYFHGMEKELLLAGLIGFGLIYWGPKDLTAVAVVFTAIVTVIAVAMLYNSRK